MFACEIFPRPPRFKTPLKNSSLPKFTPDIKENPPLLMALKAIVSFDSEVFFKTTVAPLDNVIMYAPVIGSSDSEITLAVAAGETSGHFTIGMSLYSEGPLPRASVYEASTRSLDSCSIPFASGMRQDMTMLSF